MMYGKILGPPHSTTQAEVIANKLKTEILLDIIIITLLHNKYTSFRSCSFKRLLPYVSNYKPLADNETAGTWPVWPPGVWLAGFVNRIT